MYRVEMYARVRRACRVEGMSTREASRVFGLDRKTVRKMLSFSVPPGYRRSMPRRRPKLDAFRRYPGRLPHNLIRTIFSTDYSLAFAQIFPTNSRASRSSASVAKSRSSKIFSTKPGP